VAWNQYSHLAAKDWPMDGPQGEHLDVTSDGRPQPDTQPAGRPFVGIRFACCEVYTRVYINRQRTAYRGACPRCGKPVELRIGPGGTDARFFTVT
jgi:hypothetical protein